MTARTTTDSERAVLDALTGQPDGITLWQLRDALPRRISFRRLAGVVETLVERNAAAWTAESPTWRGEQTWRVRRTNPARRPTAVPDDRSIDRRPDWPDPRGMMSEARRYRVVGFVVDRGQEVIAAADNRVEANWRAMAGLIRGSRVQRARVERRTADGWMTTDELEKRAPGQPPEWHDVEADRREIRPGEWSRPAHQKMLLTMLRSSEHGLDMASIESRLTGALRFERDGGLHVGLAHMVVSDLVQRGLAEWDPGRDGGIGPVSWTLRALRPGVAPRALPRDAAESALQVTSRSRPGFDGEGWGYRIVSFMADGSVNLGGAGVDRPGLCFNAQNQMHGPWVVRSLVQQRVGEGWRTTDEFRRRPSGRVVYRDVMTERLSGQGEVWVRPRARQAVIRAL